MSKLHVGDPLNEKTDLGPLVSEEALKTVDEQVHDIRNNLLWFTLCSYRFE